jgi:hypothetical protein
MKKRLLLALSIILVASGIFLLVRVIYNFKDIERGGLQVTSNAPGRVLLDGKYIGDIPVRKINQQETIPTGDYELRIEPQDTTLTAYTAKIRINGGALTAVDKTFLPGSLGSAYVLTLEKSSKPKAQIEITTIPDGALVTIDSVAVGSTPYKSDTLSASEHEVEIQKEGFAKKTIRVRTVDNHILVLSTNLGTGDIGTIPQATPSTSQPTPSVSPSPSPNTKNTVTILATPNGFLRVRSGAGTTFEEVTRVKQGETFTLLDEKNAWYQIQVDDQTSGWISSQYAKKD